MWYGKKTILEALFRINNDIVAERLTLSIWNTIFFRVFFFFLEEEKKKKISLLIDVKYFVNDLQLMVMNGEDLYSSFPSNEILSEIEIGKR